MRKNLAWALLAALSLTACEKEGDTDNGPVELRLTSGVEVQTKATHGLDTKIKEGLEVYVWVDNANNSTDVSAGTSLYNVLLQQGANGALSGGDLMYFPQDGNAVNIYAYCGDLGYADMGYPSASLTHRVQSDQKNTAYFSLSDILYAKYANVSRTAGSVELTFHHLLSKVEVVLKEGAGDENFLNDIASMCIANTKSDAIFTLDKTKPAYGKNNDKTDGIEITAYGNTTAIQIDAGVAPKGATEILNEAIIVPQTVEQDKDFIQIYLKGSGKFTYKLDKPTTFESGKKYKYVITANQTGLNVTSSIENWGEGGTATGEATM